MKFTILTTFQHPVRGIEYPRHVMQPSQPPTHRTFPSSQTGTLSPPSTGSPQPQRLAACLRSSYMTVTPTAGELREWGLTACVRLYLADLTEPSALQAHVVVAGVRIESGYCSAV